jgi:hypothetical protein
MLLPFINCFAGDRLLEFLLKDLYLGKDDYFSMLWRKSSRVKFDKLYTEASTIFFI